MINAYTQAKDDNQEDFSLGKFAGHMAMNSVAGALTGGAGAAVATAGKVVQVGVCAGTAALSSSGTQIGSNIINDKDNILEGAGTALVVGGLVGGLAAGAGAAIKPTQALR